MDNANWRASPPQTTKNSPALIVATNHDRSGRRALPNLVADLFDFALLNIEAADSFFNVHCCRRLQKRKSSSVEPKSVPETESDNGPEADMLQAFLRYAGPETNHFADRGSESSSHHDDFQLLRPRVRPGSVARDCAHDILWRDRHH